MRKHLARLKQSYFVFYGITYFGSALTSVSSFFMIEKLSGRVEDLGLALALKTAFMAIASPWIARQLGRVKTSRGFWLSQIAGPVLLLPLLAGLIFENQFVFFLGVALGGIPNLVLNISGTAFFKMDAGEDLATFKKNQGKLQLVIGICFSLAALVTPILLKYLGYEIVLALDFASYVVGAAYVAYLAKSFDASDTIPEAGPATAVAASAPKSTHFAAIVVGASILMIYLLKGLPPLVAGHEKLTESLGLNLTLRQTLWFFEAVAGMVAGVLYARARGPLERVRFFETGLVSGVWLLLALALPAYATLAATIFLLSLSMTLSFMKVRDDYVASFVTRADTLRATGFVNMVMNAVLTLSPLVISFVVNRFGVVPSVAGVIVLQVAAYVLLRYFRDSGGTTNLALKIQSVGSKVILTFFFFICLILTVVLHTTEKHKAEQQMNIWIQNISRSVVPHLVDGDYVPIFGKLKLLQQTDLFDRFQVYDSQKRAVSSFVNRAGSATELHEIRDEVGSVWGYYSYAPNRSYWWSSLAIVLPIVLASIVLIGILARILLKRILSAETDALERFVGSIEKQAKRIAEADTTESVVSIATDGRDIHELERIGVVIDKLAAQIRDRQARIFEQELASASARKMAELSNQVAHDIRSPLTALNMVIATVPQLSEDKRNLIKNSAQRINDIANDLLSKSKTVSETVDASQPVLVSTLVDRLLSEKRIRFGDRAGLTFGADLHRAFGLFAVADPHQLSRALSNLVNNSVEAMKPTGGRITISAVRNGARVVLCVEDDGVGIPAELMTRVTDSGFSFGKADSESGSGLGLAQVRQAMASVGGEVRIRSVEGQGTSVELSLAYAPAPVWFPSRIDLDMNRLVISVDDEATVHEIWRERLATDAGGAVRHVSFTSASDFARYMGHVSERPLLLVDYDLGARQPTGFDLIKNLVGRADCVLVTSHAESPELQAKCAAIGIKLLPKVLAAAVPIQVRRDGAAELS